MRGDSDQAGFLAVFPLTSDRWADLVALFGKRGACGGCWCQYWRRSRGQFERGKTGGNRRAMLFRVKKRPPPGILAYRGGRPIGWCAIGPRENFPALARSRVLAPVDAEQVWSVTCLFVAKPEPNRGLSKQLLEAACQYACAQSARIVEGYPVEPPARQADPFVWTGLASAFRSARFDEVARRAPTRPIMRRFCGT